MSVRDSSSSLGSSFGFGLLVPGALVLALGLSVAGCGASVGNEKGSKGDGDSDVGEDDGNSSGEGGSSGGNAGNGSDADGGGTDSPPVSCAPVDAMPAPIAVAEPVTLAIDPQQAAFADTQTLGEWNEAGQEGWTISGATLQVASDALRVEGQGSVPVLERLGLTDIDLDRGFRDVLDLRVQLPAGYAGDLALSYTTDTEQEFSENKRIRLSAAQLSDDGAFHVYRLFVGAEQRLRGKLTGLRVSFSSALAAKETLLVDYVRIGDVEGDVYKTETNADVTGLPVVTSKHFAIYYNAADYPVAKVPGTLRNLEEMWYFYHHILKYPEPGALKDGRRVKILVKIAADTCFACAGGTGMGLQPSAAEPNPPSLAVAHELMHNFQSSSTGIHGQYWENNANYGRERYMYWYAHLFTVASNLEAFQPATSHWDHGHGRHYYLSWPIWLYMDENPDGLKSLGDGTAGRAWVETKENESMYTALERVIEGVSVQDILGYMARRNVTWNYSHKAELNEAVSHGDQDILSRWTRADLRKRPDAPDVWQVAEEMAPMQTGYTTHELLPTPGASKVVVNFRGLEDTLSQADFRASLVVVDQSGRERYSPLFRDGDACMELTPEDARIYVAVAATPKQFSFISWEDDKFPYQAHPGKARMLYELKIEGAEPVESAPKASGEGAAHANGGGFVSKTASVAATAYVGPNAMVLGRAKVLAEARIEDYAVVKDEATITDQAIISGHAVVRGKASVSGSAKVRDYATVSDSAKVQENARVLQRALVVNEGILKGDATAKGLAEVNGSAGSSAGGDAVLDGDYGAGHNVTNGFHYGFVPYNGTLKEWIDTRKAPANLFAAYSFDGKRESLAKDTYGTTDAYLVGAPAWQEGSGAAGSFYTLDGKSQYLLLDRSLSDFSDLTLAVWVKLDELKAQPILFLGASDTRSMSLVLDASGVVSFVAKNGDKTEELKASAPLKAGQWTLVTVTLAGDQDALYLNEGVVAQGKVSTRPDQLLAPNTNHDLQHNYLGRDLGEGRFQGSLGGFYVYSRALDAARIAKLTAGTL